MPNLATLGLMDIRKLRVALAFQTRPFLDHRALARVQRPEVEAKGDKPRRLWASAEPSTMALCMEPP